MTVNDSSMMVNVDEFIVNKQLWTVMQFKMNKQVI